MNLELNGRRKIYTAVSEINDNNILTEVQRSLNLHAQNVMEEEYLFWYRRGIQPIKDKKKEVRSEINHKICVNNADPVVNFKNGYFMVKPAYYISRKKGKTSEVKKINEYLYLSGKHTADNKVVDSFHTMGLGNIFVQPNASDNIPFSVYNLDCRSSYVVYSMGIGNKPVYGVNIAIVDKEALVDVYTKDYCYRCKADYTQSAFDEIAKFSALKYVEPYREINGLGYIPIIEYQANANRMASFEAGISIADAINHIESLRHDGIDQFIQSLLILTNCELPEGTTANDVRRLGMIQLKSNGDNKASFDQLTQQLDQTQTQVTLDDLYAQFYDKCAMPSTNRNGGGTSDNGSAVYLREGYAQADTYARNTEDNFKEANRYFDEIMLSILKKKGLIKDTTELADFELKIEQNTASNLLVKTQSAINMKTFGLSPEICLEKSGLSSDPVQDVENSRKYIDIAWNVNQPQEQTFKSGQQPNEIDNLERVQTK